jgi:hypothetical protein
VTVYCWAGADRAGETSAAVPDDSVTSSCHMYRMRSLKTFSDVELSRPELAHRPPFPRVSHVNGVVIS